MTDYKRELRERLGFLWGEKKKGWMDLEAGGKLIDFLISYSPGL